ncbi:hypothetical protein LCGC14_0575750 [marine sediment metagenome]|uniref:Uncharacterized protein n=1 Tax=marine sediment metagenome TaxID=412755 RepID=A0A0F9S1F4_9ZZZZ
MTQNELDQLAAELKTRIKATDAKRLVLCKQLQLDKDKLGWLQGMSRYGDIVEVKQYRGYNKEPTLIQVVVLGIDTFWRSCAPIKRDGRLSRNHKMAENDLVPVGRYDGDDLPEPNEAAQFGLLHPAADD